MLWSCNENREKSKFYNYFHFLTYQYNKKTDKMQEGNDWTWQCTNQKGSGWSAKGVGSLKSLLVKKFPLIYKKSLAFRELYGIIN